MKIIAARGASNCCTSVFLRTSSSTDLNFEFEPNPMRGGGGGGGGGGNGVSIADDGVEGRASSVDFPAYSDTP